jgi:hypothetical protein
MTPINGNAKILGEMFTQAGFEIRLVGGAKMVDLSPESATLN